MSSSAKPAHELRAGRFRFFISYAREDYNIAIAVNNAIQTAAGPAAEVFMDVALQFGVNFQEEIKNRLDETNVLVVIHSGILKSAFSFTGLELGYFLHVMESERSPDFPRRIVPIYLDKPPDAIAADAGRQPRRPQRRRSGRRYRSASGAARPAARFCRRRRPSTRPHLVAEHSA